jgi:predicted nucleic acid-binding protein
VIKQAIIDTGPLVAFLDRDEKYHRWTVEQIENLTAPLLVCEAVLTETMFLLRRLPPAQSAVIRLLENGALVIKFSLAENVAPLKTLFSKYRDTGISLADACLIKMAELNEGHAVFTLDSDFRVYRKHGRQAIQLIYPKR